MQETTNKQMKNFTLFMPHHINPNHAVEVALKGTDKDNAIANKYGEQNVEQIKATMFGIQEKNAPKSTPMTNTETTDSEDIFC